MQSRGGRVLITEVAHPEDPIQLVPVHNHLPLDMICGAYDAVQIPLIDHQVKGAIRGGHQKAVTMLPYNCRNGCIVGGSVFAVILYPGPAATVTLDHLINRQLQKVDAEDRFEPHPLRLTEKNPRTQVQVTAYDNERRPLHMNHPGRPPSSR